MPPLAAGLLSAASLPPWGFWIGAFAGAALLAWHVWTLTSRWHRGRAAFLYGVGLFAPTLFWMTEFHAVGYVLVVLLETTILAGALSLVPTGALSALALPAAFALGEALRDAWPFGGLPLGGITLGQAGSPLAPAAAIGGGLLVAALVTAGGAAIAAAARRRLVLAICLATPVVLFPLAGRAVAPSATEGTAIKVAAVQGGGVRGLRAIYSDPQNVLDAHLRVSDRVQGPIDLVLWPENAIDVDSIDDSDAGRALAALAVRTHATVIAGVTEEAGANGFENVAVAWDPNGDIVDRYVKAHRVPFGEYVPGRALISHLADLSVLPRDAVAGHRPGVLHTPIGRLGVTISYEVLFRDRARIAARDGGRLLLVPTNASSFKTGQVPAQELAASRLRAWETGRWVVQSAPTGYGAFVDPRGRVVARTSLGRATLLTGSPRLLSVETPYDRVGDGPVLAVAVVVLVAAAFFERRRGAALAG